MNKCILLFIPAESSPLNSISPRVSEAAGVAESLYKSSSGAALAPASVDVNVIPKASKVRPAVKLATDTCLVVLL